MYKIINQSLHRALICAILGLAGCSGESDSRKTLSTFSVSIPAGANSWLLNDPMRSDAIISDEGILNWTNAEDEIQTYFRTNRIGTFSLGIKVAVKSGVSRLKVTLNGISKEVTIDNTTAKNIYVGEFEITQIGYQTIHIQGISKESNTFADITQVLLDGEAVDGEIQYIKEDVYFGRRGPSVHLVFDQLPTSNDIEWFYNEITVPEGEDVIGSYYMANGFGEGYFGIQVNSETERRVLFSVWSPYQTDDPSSIPDEYKIELLKKGENVYTGEFGNEGSGGQSYLVHPWKAGVTYKFLLKGTPVDNSMTDYTAYFFDPDLNEWLLIASFRRPKTNTYLTNLYSFLENFIPNAGANSRMALYSNQWVRDTAGSWHEITNMRFGADATAKKQARMDYQGGIDGSIFFLRNCGFFNDKTVIDTRFNRSATDTPPNIDFAVLPQAN
ncbi:DUF3472 domain-containing protein [Reichenbachiella sp.]|uniref:DUF3472 domain-containing protein n=1 Tax=Reichenbachiella sp. TaxID=2184521 RepID=UPI003298BBEF